MSHHVLTIAALCTALAGCSHFNHGSSFRAIASEPSAPLIELTVPATVSDEGATTTFPAGKYKPVYEDEGGYYYEAPGKVLMDDIATYAFDGGVYVKRGHTNPTQWYVIRPNGRRTMGHFKAPPMYKVAH
ncbi:MAG: hypothetical protein ACJ8M1_09235 [Chthoniobacterales bacterium]